MIFTAFESPFDKRTHRRQEVTWAEVREMLTTHVEKEEKQAYGFSPTQFKAGACDCGAEKCPGPMGHAILANVVETYMIGIDLDRSRDGGDIGVAEAREYLNRLQERGLAYIAHTSHSFCNEKAAWHVFLPLSRPVTTDEYRRVWKAFFQWIDIPSGIKTDNAARYWNLPSCKPNGPRAAEAKQGEPIDVEWFLALMPEEKPTVGEHVPVDRAETPILQAAWKDIKDRGGAEEGRGGHDHTFQIARVLVNEWALDRDQARSLLGDWNEGCVPPWSDAELDHKVDSAIAAGPNGDYATLRNGFDFLRAFEKLNAPEAGSLRARVQWAQQQWEAVSLDAEQKEEMFTMSFAELRNQTFPKTPWLIDGLLTEGGIGTISAEPKSTKTWAAIEWCLAVCAGDRAFGEFQAYKGNCAYFFAEDDGGAIVSRVNALLEGTGREVPDNFYPQPAGHFIDLMDDTSVVLTLAALKRLPPLSLLVLDPLRDIHKSNEDNATEMGELVQRLRKIAKITGATVIFVHHNSKASADTLGRRHGQRMRGSSALHGAVNSGFYMSDVELDENRITTTCFAEIKKGKAAAPFHLCLEIVDDDNGAAIKAEWTILEEDARAEGDELVAELIFKVGEWERNKMNDVAPLLATHLNLKAAQWRKTKRVAMEQGFIEDVPIARGLSGGMKLTDLGKKAYEEMLSSGFTSNS